MSSKKTDAANLRPAPEPTAPKKDASRMMGLLIVDVLAARKVTPPASKKATPVVGKKAKA